MDCETSNFKPINTVRSENNIWQMFQRFCDTRGYKFESNTTVSKLADIMKDWSSNMRKKDGTDYRENVVKIMFNVSAKLLQKKYLNEFNRDIDPFHSIAFSEARKARNAKRKQLREIPETNIKQLKLSSGCLSTSEIRNIAATFDENTPDGLQKKFFSIAAPELAWRANEATFCLVEYFIKELSNDGSSTLKLEYNTIHSKTAQDDEQSLVSRKWLISNTDNEDFCPVRLFDKIISKRSKNIKTNRLFLTPNKEWNSSANSYWYKNTPVGLNEIRKWSRVDLPEV